jgi:hypothetical protein
MDTLPIYQQDLPKQPSRDLNGPQILDKIKLDAVEADMMLALLKNVPTEQFGASGFELGLSMQDQRGPVKKENLSCNKFRLVAGGIHAALRMGEYWSCRRTPTSMKT